jgi:hypothetical protein
MGCVSRIETMQRSRARLTALEHLMSMMPRPPQQATERDDPAPPAPARQFSLRQVYLAVSSLVLYGALDLMTVGDSRPIGCQPKLRTIGKCALVVFPAHLVALTAGAVHLALALPVLLFGLVGGVSLLFAFDLQLSLVVVICVYSPAVIALLVWCLFLANLFFRF